MTKKPTMLCLKNGRNFHMEFVCMRHPRARSFQRFSAADDERDWAAAIGALMLGATGHKNFRVTNQTRQSPTDERACVAGRRDGCLER
jgi:hypothetical protein